MIYPNDQLIQVAIDGPAGAGKSTVAKKTADQLGFCYLDTGAMYRVIAYKALQMGIDLRDEAAVTSLADQIEIRLEHDPQQAVFCDDVDVTEEIRSAEVSRAVSIVAAYGGVRKRMVELQRKQAEHANVVMDGRDIGTNVLPDARVKIYLTANPQERARRRFLEMQDIGRPVTLDEVLRDIMNRDQMDTERTHAPLKPASDAVILDTTGMSVDKVVQKIVNIVREARS